MVGAKPRGLSPSISCGWSASSGRWPSISVEARTRLHGGLRRGEQRTSARTIESGQAPCAHSQRQPSCMGARECELDSCGAAIDWPAMSNESRRRKVKHAILRSRFPGKACMARAYLRAVERYRSLRGARENALHANGLPVPPPRLRALVGPTVSMDWFLASGEAQADYLRYVAS